MGFVGLAFYVYRELLSRLFRSLHDYQVAAVTVIEEGLVEVSLRPVGKGIDFVAGQFAMVYLEAKDGWHRHPFTIASAPHEGTVRFTVKALGDYTARLADLIEPGMPAVIGGPHGRFNHQRGTDRQIWVAGGVGVAPFLSWFRALDVMPATHVDFYYSAVGDPAFADEIREIAGRHPAVEAHIIDSSVEGRLTAARMLTDVNADPRGLSVFMCGPASMLASFQTQFRAAGVPGRRIHREYFDWR